MPGRGAAAAAGRGPPRPDPGRRADTRGRERAWFRANTRIGGISLGGILVIVGIIVALFWSIILGVIIALVGLIAFGGFVRGKWY